MPPSAPRSRLAVVVLGSGGPVSAGRGASGYVLLVDGTPRILVDAGPGAFLRLGQLQLDLTALDTVLLTHLHIDHSGDLPGFVKDRDLSMDGPVRFLLVGPAGADPYPSTTAFEERLFGPSGAFAYLKTFRNSLRFDVVDLPVAQDAPPTDVLHAGELHVTAIPVDHGEVPAAAFRIELAGHAVVISGDLASKNDNLARLAAGADVLIYDTTVLDPPGSPAPLYDLHTPPRRIGEIASMAHVRSLVLSHIPPSVEHARRAVVESIRGSYGGAVHFAEDCEVLETSLPSPP
jgi:ribonuclease BN (tRNA processing enzyme)